MRAQVALEFVTSYGWALLVLLVFVAVAYYLLSTRPVTPECNFGIEIYCRSYQFLKKSDGTMRLVAQLSNGMGKDISFYRKNQTITVQNVGKGGMNNYTGNCTGPAEIVRGGDLVLCIFDIVDTEAVPEVGRAAKFDVLLNYTNCQTDPRYPASCVNGTNKTMRGTITSVLESMPPVTEAYCMDSVCTPPENSTNCPWDCPP